MLGRRIQSQLPRLQKVSSDGDGPHARWREGEETAAEAARAPRRGGARYIPVGRSVSSFIPTKNRTGSEFSALTRWLRPSRAASIQGEQPRHRAPLRRAPRQRRRGGRGTALAAAAAGAETGRFLKQAGGQQGRQPWPPQRRLVGRPLRGITPPSRCAAHWPPPSRRDAAAAGRGGRGGRRLAPGAATRRRRAALRARGGMAPPRAVRRAPASLHAASAAAATPGGRGALP